MTGQASQRMRSSRPRGAASAAGVPVKLDVSVPTAALPALVDRLHPAVLAVAPGARTIVFGHVNEGNLHVNVLDAGAAAEEVTGAVLRLVAELHGSISSEHGVGRAKRDALPDQLGPDVMALTRRIKDALDPQGILNPGAGF